MRAVLNRKFLGISVAFTAIQIFGSLITGCTGQLPGSFRWAQQNELLGLAQDINTKVDILWVVDNSASMDVSQDKLRTGFASFASTYLKPTWDIQLAVITTDTYLANSAFATYRSTVKTGTTGLNSAYVNTRAAAYTNPVFSSLLSLVMGTYFFSSGIKYNDEMPLLTANYAKLSAGIHDGPITALCTEQHPYFYYGEMNCSVRDAAAANTGVSHCVSPVGAETATTQCVNTVENNTVRSGKPIISTLPPAGTPGDSTWVNQLVSDFVVNVSVGTSGNGSERGLQSVSQLLTDNEYSGSPTALFRENSIRLIIFVGDEEDQSMPVPSSPGAGFGPSTNYTSTCSSKTVDSHTYTIGVCPTSGSLEAVSTYKTQLDSFFNTLDSSSTGSSTYFIASIVALTGSTISTLQSARDTGDAAIGMPTSVAVDRADRYIELGTLVGNGSLSLNIGDSDYSALLTSIGRAIALKRGTFTLKREPSGSEDMIVTIIHANGSTDVISSSSYSISGKSLTITDVNYVLSLISTDQISVNYQPKNVF